ncbi:trypsin-like serine protease [Sorangium sp. So ce726]|uniref:S1 family peptidase n=1 Tax=Sorangium sp. So ce726 TaxID=3133319 RepID=UPI003F63ABB9
MRTISKLHLGFLLAGISASCLLPACSGAPVEGGEESVDSASQEIIGGVDARSNALDAIGSLGVALEAVNEETGAVEVQYRPFCSGTLIGKSTVLTAKHCVDAVRPMAAEGRVVFGVGFDGKHPDRTVDVAEIGRAPGDEGGFVGLGRDVGVVHLDEEITDIEPAAIDDLSDADIHTRFAAIGYGVQDNDDTSGTRKAGSVTLQAREGKVFELMFGSFEAFKQWFMTRDRSELLARLSAKAEAEGNEGEDACAEDSLDCILRMFYDGNVLLAGYEAFVGAGKGDAQTCYGDSGSPLVRMAGGKLRVHGVVSGGISTNQLACDYGTVYATLGPEVLAFAKKASTWSDPCGDTAIDGVCEGFTATRCTALDEGPRRVTKTDCSLLGQTCGQDETGAVACVDPGN